MLGDVAATDLGVCYAHEHLVIDGGVPKIINPEISLQDEAAAIDELGACARAGVRSVVDAMPADAGRNVDKLAAISRDHRCAHRRRHRAAPCPLLRRATLG